MTFRAGRQVRPPEAYALDLGTLHGQIHTIRNSHREPLKLIQCVFRLLLICLSHLEYLKMKLSSKEVFGSSIAVDCASSVELLHGRSMKSIQGSWKLYGLKMFKNE
jgi:hypothetical protein